MTLPLLIKLIKSYYNFQDIPTGNATVLILEPKKSVVEDFYTWIQEKDGNGQEENQDVFEDPMAWQIMKAIYGVMIHNVSSVDFNSARLVLSCYIK